MFPAGTKSLSDPAGAVAALPAGSPVPGTARAPLEPPPSPGDVTQRRGSEPPLAALRELPDGAQHLFLAEMIHLWFPTADTPDSQLCHGPLRAVCPEPCAGSLQPA